MGERLTRVLVSVAVLAILVPCLTWFAAFVHVPRSSLDWGLVGTGLDTLNLHRLYVGLPRALVWTGIALAGLLALQARDVRWSRVRWDEALLRACLVLAPLVLLAPITRWGQDEGRVALAALVVGLSAWVAWPVVLEFLGSSGRRAAGRDLRVLFAAGLLAAACAVLYFCVGWMRHRAMWSSLVDLGLFYELFSDPEGRFLYSSILGHGFLGEHFSPILIVLWPFMRLLPSPLTLIAFQSVSIALGGLLLFAWARERTGHPVLALVLAAAYLLNPYVQQAAFYDFHMDMLEPPLVFGAMLALSRGRSWGFVACCVLLWLTKEDTFIYTSVMGLWAALFERRRVLGILVIVAGLAQAALVLGWVLPELRPERDWDHFATTSSTQGYAFLSRYRHLGDTPLEMVETVLTRPGYVAGHLLTSWRLAGIVSLFACFGGLALAGRGRMILLVPTLEMLLASMPGMSKFRFYYGAVAMMFAALAAVEGAHVLCRHWERERSRGRDPVVTPGRIAFFLAAVVVALVAWHPSSWSSRQNSYVSYLRLDHAELADEILDSLPDGTRVSASGYLGVRAQDRLRVSMFPYGTGDSDVVVVDLQRPTWPRKPWQVQSKISSLVRSGRFRPVRLEDGFVVLERTDGGRAAGQDVAWLLEWMDTPVIEAENSELTRFRGRIRLDPEASGGACVSVGTSDARGPGHLVWGPFRDLRPGRYRAVFRVRWSDDTWIPLPQDVPALSVDVRHHPGVTEAQGGYLVRDMGAIEGRWMDLSLDFVVDRGEKRFEFRVLHHDVGRLELDCIRIEKRPVDQ